MNENPIRHPSLPDYVVRAGDQVIRAEIRNGSDGTLKPGLTDNILLSVPNGTSVIFHPYSSH